MNKIIKNVLIKLEKSGFEGYIVGGYVRDKLLRRNTYDVDICTNAHPKDLCEMFGFLVNTSYGSFSFKVGKYNFDITTYRKENKYVDRKPTEIEYINSLEDDLARRDFTINTLCMDKNGKIIDHLGARKDLNNQLIKIIGDSDIKFIEDPLRMLRAVRFASTLNFEIDEDVKKAIIRNRLLIKTLSKDRIKSEISKILLSKNYVYGFSLLKEFKILEVLEIEYNSIIFSSDLLVMFSQLKMSDNYFTKKEIKQIKNIKKILNYGKIDSAMLFKFNLYTCIVVGEVFGTSKSAVNKIYKNMWINEVKPLCISGRELMEASGIPSGKVLGKLKSELESLILEKKLLNDRKKIIEYIKQRK